MKIKKNCTSSLNLTKRNKKDRLDASFYRVEEVR